MENNHFLLSLFAFSFFYVVYGAIIKVTIEPHNVPVWYVKDRPLVLTCKVHTDENVNIVWTRNEIPVNTDEYKIDTWVGDDSDGPTRNVRITKTRAGDQDSAHFRCSARNVDQLTHTSMFTMITLGDSVSSQDNSTLRCQTDLDYSMKRITWYKKDIPLDQVKDLYGRFVLGPNNSTLTFIKAKQEDSGEYICRVEVNPDTQMLQIFQEKVALQSKPYISHQGVIKDESRSSIVLKCRINGYPAPDVFWKRVDAYLESTGKYKIHSLAQDGTSQLQINSATDSDMEEYTCIAENSLGRDSYTFSLRSSGAMNYAFNLILFDCPVFKINMYILAAIITVAMIK